MATRKQPYINQPFTEEVKQKAFLLIDSGKDLIGGFWKNRSISSRRLGYENWKAVPETIRDCVNQIGREASRKGKLAKKEIGQVVKAVPSGDAFVPIALLENIYDGTFKIPRNTSATQLLTIRQYVTQRSGFDPAKILLGVESRMEKPETKYTH